MCAARQEAFEGSGGRSMTRVDGAATPSRYLITVGGHFIVSRQLHVSAPAPPHQQWGPRPCNPVARNHPAVTAMIKGGFPNPREEEGSTLLDKTCLRQRQQNVLGGICIIRAHP
jgi:hypothetical protein